MNPVATFKRYQRLHQFGTRTYRAWDNMIQRCSSPSYPGYHRYGGRGIRVCDRWLVYGNFLEDMGTCPEGLTLDRKDTDGNYAPENCRWATRKQQARNTSRTIWVMVEGRVARLVDEVEARGLKYQKVYTRINRLGWPLLKALEVAS